MFSICLDSIMHPDSLILVLAFKTCFALNADAVSAAVSNLKPALIVSFKAEVYLTTQVIYRVW